MNKYVKTELPASLYLNCLQYRLKYLSRSLTLKNKARKELKDKYNLKLEEIVPYLIKNIRCSEIYKDLKQLYFIDEAIKKSNLNEIIRFLEYGSLDITAPKLISSYLNKAIILTREDIGE